MQHTVFINDPSQLSGKQLLVSWPGHQTMIHLTEPELRLGRAPQDNDIVIDVPMVSRYHATLKWDGISYDIIDGQTLNGQHRPSANGLYVEGKRVSEHKLVNGDIIRLTGENQNFITLTYLDHSAPSSIKSKRIRLDKEIRIGRKQDNDFILPDPLVSGIHAVISPTTNGHLVQDRKSSNGTFVNGQRIAQATLRAGDIIQLGSTRLQYMGQELISADLRRDGIRLDAINLHKSVKVKKATPDGPDFKILIDQISLAIQPREFVAIVGGSGTGKSTVLDALNGFRPAEGRVLINGDDFYKNFNAYRQSIGYVPQDDIIHRELTVEEALRYVALLRLPPDTQAEEIEKRIDTALEQMAMSERRHVLIKQLSGGQRKRVSIAVELIADPGIIFLDEPTSGLDPGLDQKMMFTLRQVANAGKTVILVTHATGNITECSLVAFLAAGGRLTFFGPPQDALTFFKVNNFAAIYNLVEQEPDQWIETFQKSGYYHTYVQERLAELNDHQSGQRSTTASSKNGDSLPQKIKTSLRQSKILTQRYLTMLSRDRRNLFLLLAQVPFVAILLFFVIGSDLFTAEGCTLNNALTFVNANNLPCNTVTVTQVGQVQKILFILACVAIWLGIFSASREIVKELPIYRRERLVNLSILAYVSSKLVVLFGLSVFQSFLLVLLVHSWANFPAVGAILPSLGVAEIFITMTFMTFTSASFGLFLSAIMGREDRVMSVMPLFLLLQIVFAGIVFPVTPFAEHMGTWFLSLFTFSRWGIEAMGSTVNLAALWAATDNTVKAVGQNQLPYLFEFNSSYLLQKWGILFSFTILSIILTVLSLKQKDVH